MTEISTTVDLIPYARSHRNAAVAAADFWRTAANPAITSYLTGQLMRAGMVEDRASEEARRFTQAADFLAEQWAAVDRAAVGLRLAHDQLLAAANSVTGRNHTGIRIC